MYHGTNFWRAPILAKNESYHVRNLAIALVKCEWIEENKLATKKYDHGTDWKISQTRFSGYREAIITQIGSVEEGYYKAWYVQV